MPTPPSGVVSRVHAALSSFADKVSGHGTPLRRVISPIYGRALRSLSGARGIAATINGETFRIDPRFRAVFPAVYEPELLQLLRERLAPGACMFDIGANLGIWVLHAARLTGSTGKVVAFEPNPSTAEVLRTHVRMNGMERQVRVEELALASRSGSARLFGAVPGAGTSRLDEANQEAAGSHIEVDVIVTTLDDYCRQSQLVPSVVLIDVEGFELDVLGGGVRTIAAHPEMTVVVELHPSLWPPGSGERLRQLVEDLGRTAVGMSGQSDIFTEYGQIRLERSAPMSGKSKQAFAVTMTEEEWRARLSPEQFKVLRQHATERPGSCALLHEKREGTFTCAGCGQPLFVNERKFESGTGWPSFFEPIEGSIGTTVDDSLFMVRTEVHCSRCGGHLGHVFEDGPPPTGLRYCINGVALDFEPS